MKSHLPLLLFAVVAVGALVVLTQHELRAHEPAPAGLQPVSVRAEKPVVRDLEVRLSYPAELQPFARSRIRSVGARGVVRAVYVDKGDKVRKGQRLVTVDCPDYEMRQRQAEKEVRNLSAFHENTRRIVGRLRPVRAQKLIAQQELDVAEATHDVALERRKAAERMVEEAKASLGFCEIRAPFSGEVGMRWLDPGAQLRPGPTEILRLIDISKIRVWVNVVERDARYLRDGLPVELRVVGLPKHVFKGKVTRFARGLDNRSRTVLTEIVLPNRHRLLRPGMFGRVEIVAEKRAAAVVVPEKALLTQACGDFGEKTCDWVYVLDGDKARRVPVVRGHEMATSVQIAKGLRGDERIVTQGRELVGDGSLVRVVP